MAETVYPGPVSDLSAVREATCIHTKMIFDSCQSKDCIEDLRLYPTQSSQPIIDQALSVKAGRARLLYTLVNVEPMGLNRGFFTVDLRYYYKITCDAFTGCTRPMQVSGLAVFDKRAILFGSESTAKSFTSMAGCPELTEDMVLTNDLPTAVVEAVDPIILSMRLCNVCERPMCGECALTEVPAAIQAAFDEPISLENNTVRRIYLSLGQFSILRMERDAHLLIPVYDYCMPDKECECDRCDEDPCDIFQQVSFPVGEFFPPANANAIDPLNELRKNCCQ